MNDREKKLISLLQPKEYKSRIKLYCIDNKFNIQKFCQVEKKTYISRVEIKEK